MNRTPTISPQRASSPTSAIRHLHLDPLDAEQVDALTRAVARQYGDSTAPALLAAAAGLAHRLPARLVDEVRGLRLYESAPALVLHGLRVDDTEVGPTPPDWHRRDDPARTGHLEVALVLVSALLGEIFGWSTLQEGRLVHNVVPMRGEEREQSGHGTVKLEWHTEDGFHPYRCDYLLLLGVRNHDAVPTTLAAVDWVDIDPRHRAVLWERRFLIRPDNEHLKRARALTADSGQVHTVQRMQETPEPSAVLFGQPKDPYLRIDPAFMTAVPGDAEAAEALAALVAALDGALTEVALDAGDLLVVDNYRAVHGRCAFRARHDGTDRWLKKAVVTRDLRKSRGLRGDAHDRILL